MPDAKRKLPVIAISTTSLMAMQDSYVRMIVWPCVDGDPFDTGPAGTTRYEPAVPRCATCGHRREDEYGLFCIELKDARGNSKPVTLAGYCDQHAEAQHV